MRATGRALAVVAVVAVLAAGCDHLKMRGSASEKGVKDVDIVVPF